MNTIHLSPNDVLFFRDGRPMDSASSGDGAAWPLPHVLNAAFHAALHRAGIDGVHEHHTGRSSDRGSTTRDQKFGSLTTTGPFPVNPSGRWLFPRPADAQAQSSAATTLRPLVDEHTSPSSLADGLYPVVNTEAPTKEKPEPWMTKEAWEAYLEDGKFHDPSGFVNDLDLSDAEHQIGIAIDPNTETTVEGQFYSASYLRLRAGWSLGVLAESYDKVNGDRADKRDLIRSLLDQENHIIIGGQQRVCGAIRRNTEGGTLPLPVAPRISGILVKWTLLSPAIFPQISDHPGGWLPSWIDTNDMRVQLLDGPGRNKAKRLGLAQGQRIGARLVAACIPRAIPITGWALAAGDSDGGAKSTHLAVPAGAVYYFEADNEAEAQKLADALNWHGEADPGSQARGAGHNQILNRRSTLFGEKGFGLGVCSAWVEHKSSNL